MVSVSDDRTDLVAVGVQQGEVALTILQTLACSLEDCGNLVFPVAVAIVVERSVAGVEGQADSSVLHGVTPLLMGVLYYSMLVVSTDNINFEHLQRIEHGFAFRIE
jgi:hypothetical protein